MPATENGTVEVAKSSSTFAPLHLPESLDRLAPRSRVGYWVLVAVISAVGIFLRIYPTSGFPIAGFDATLYRGYILELERTGFRGYPGICRGYIERQQKLPSAVLPPTRVLYIACGYLWKRTFWGDAPPVADVATKGALRVDPVLRSLRAVSCTFGIAALALAGVAAWRMLGRGAVPAVLALMACTPTQLHMSQNVLVDGFVAFWAALCFWLVWENLRHPGDARWLGGLALALASLVLAKENAAFVCVGLGAIILSNRWTRIGTITPSLLIACVGGCLAGVLALTLLAGGWATLLKTYQLLVTKALVLDYAIRMCDGPWYRYFVDELIISPFAFCLAIGACFCVLREQAAYRAAFLFIAGSYLLMCNVRYGANLRYAAIWDLAIRLLVFGQVVWISRHAGHRQWLVAALLVAALCLYDLRQYYLFSVKAGLHEMTTYMLIRAAGMYKP